jgi:phage FluMu gp28-like protein
MGSDTLRTISKKRERKAPPGADAGAGNRKSEMGDLRTVAGPKFRLLAYQKRWVEDRSPLKIVVKARQIGYSFAATLGAVLRCLEQKTTWILLSKGERQSRLLMEKVQEHVQACGAVARSEESAFFEGTSARQLEVRFSNGSVIYGLPANPETARGYSGNVTLDEFAFHSDAAKIYAALFPSITRGYSMEVISTPNGTQGKFYELAKAAGLTGDAPGEAGPKRGASGVTWSAHRCDVYEAARQGLRLNFETLRSGCDDETTWQQEYCCEFVSLAENFFSPELLAACLSAEASTDCPVHLLAPGRGVEEQGLGVRDGDPFLRQGRLRSPPPGAEFFLGIDVGRRHDRTVFWVDEVRETGGHAERDAAGSVAVARMVRVMDRAPFAGQLRAARELLSARGSDGRPVIRRAAIDATGIGAMLAETLAHEFAPRVEAVNFTNAVKEEMAFRTRRRMEAGLTRLPDSREVRRAFSAVKKLVTASGHLRFDAARTEAGHADEFWAKALADLAAESRPAARLEEGFLAAGPVVDARAFVETAAGWAGLG